MNAVSTPAIFESSREICSLYEMHTAWKIAASRRLRHNNYSSLSLLWPFLFHTSQLGNRAASQDNGVEGISAKHIKKSTKCSKATNNEICTGCLYCRNTLRGIWLNFISGDYCSQNIDNNDDNDNIDNNDDNDNNCPVEAEYLFQFGLFCAAASRLMTK